MYSNLSGEWKTLVVFYFYYYRLRMKWFEILLENPLQAQEILLKSIFFGSTVCSMNGLYLTQVLRSVSGLYTILYNPFILVFDIEEDWVFRRGVFIIFCFCETLNLFVIWSYIACNVR